MRRIAARTRCPTGSGHVGESASKGNAASDADGNWLGEGGLAQEKNRGQETPHETPRLGIQPKWVLGNLIARIAGLSKNSADKIDHQQKQQR